MKRTPLFRLMLGLVTLSFMLAIAPPAAAVPDAPTATSIFINEIHYDNTGTDSGEAIEIAAPSGTNLTGWTIVLYNGSGGASYDTDPLGAVDGTCGSYDLYVVNYASNGIQNGSPDGMALVDASNTVIQFLSYEGVFAATNGAANGMTSTDIDVSENGSGAVGNSLQLAGTGTVYTDFAWQAEAANTFGACNTGQTFGDVGDTAPTITSTNPTDGATGVAVDATITVTFSEAVTFNSQVEINCSGSGIQNVTPAGGPTAWTLPHTDFQNSETCTVTIEAADVSDADTEDPPDNMGADTSWSFTTVGAGGVDLLINEVDADTPGTDAAEFVELYDGGVGSASLDGFVVVFFNGNGDTSYAALDLDGYATDTNGIFVLGNTGVPSVDVVFGGNSLQNGADAVALYLGDATDFPNGTAVTTANLIDAIVYDMDDADDAGLLVLLNAGQPQVNENGRGKVTDHSNQRCPNGAGGARNTASYDQFSPTPGSVNLCPDYIHAIQGSGDTSTPGAFTVEAIVVGDFQGVTGVDDYKLDGFFIQEEDADVDADPATSEGIFVYCASCPTNVVVGDKVQVTGPSSEYYGMSQLTATTAGAVVVVSSGNTLPTPAAITLPVPGVTATDLATAQTQINAYYEPFEGMLVRVAEQLSVTEYFELYRYGQLLLAQGGRFRQFTDTSAPSTAGYTAHQIDLARRTVILDDDSNQQNHALMEDPDIPVFHPVPGFSITNYVRGGATITGLTGALHWSFAGLTGTDAWRIRPVTEEPTFSYAFTASNPRPAAPTVSGNLKVASFNVLNYFTTLNSRGAHSTAELDRQAAKIVAAFTGLDADVIGVMEIENNNDVAIADLVSRLNAAAGAGAYAYVSTGTVGSDQITVGIIYKPGKVTPVGAAQTLTAAAFTDPNNTGTQRSRPAVAQTFEEATWGERFTVVVNHLKSKGSCPGSGPDADQGDGQGCWNDTRQKAATYLVNTWLPGDPTGSSDPDFLIIGDLNSYRLEAPITTITGAGYTDLIDSTQGAAGYGYLFDGQLGYLDHALGSAALTPQVAGLAEWHINADEVNLLDYNDTVQDTGEATFDAKPTATVLYEANAYRSSDHDPVLVGLDLYPDQSTLSGYAIAWHTGNGALRLGDNWSRDEIAGADTGDDGVVCTPGYAWPTTGAGRSGKVDVTVTGAPGYVTGWIDWNSDDDFTDAGEQIFANEAFDADGTRTITFPIPDGVAVGSAMFNARFRVYPAAQTALALAAATPAGSAGAPSPSGGAAGGEVEDYQWAFGPNAVMLRDFSAAGAAGAGWPAIAGFGALGIVLLARRRRR